MISADTMGEPRTQVSNTVATAQVLASTWTAGNPVRLVMATTDFEYTHMDGTPYVMTTFGLAGSLTSQIVHPAKLL